MINKVGELQINCQLTMQEKKVANVLLKYWQTGGNKQPLGIVARVVSRCSIGLRLKLQCSDTKQAVYKAKIQGLLD